MSDLTKEQLFAAIGNPERDNHTCMTCLYGIKNPTDDYYRGDKPFCAECGEMNPGDKGGNDHWTWDRIS